MPVVVLIPLLDDMGIPALRADRSPVRSVKGHSQVAVIPRFRCLMFRCPIKGSVPEHGCNFRHKIKNCMID
ncbi:hypothetical protein [uncultured Methanoregula sp.]|uniref:hypothetical protein n=1 Tax=uncultured Methanoregula sp. TaxID=1005933 RepID=UPI002AAAC9CF|nr:hypothetical protein [uncultured Methanoregula sp.]